jgi:glycosyltransferase involved in cell wall biosynthesis
MPAVDVRLPRMSERSSPVSGTMAGVSRPVETPVLRVGVNLLWCRPGRVGGTEEYLARQLLGLAAVAPEVTARLLVPPGFAAAHPELSERFEIVTASTATRYRPGRLLAETLAVPAMIADADVVHHAGGTLPVWRSGIPTLLTVHDAQYLTYPHYFSRPRRTYLRRRLPPSVSRASAIAVPSRFVGTTLVDAFGADRARVTVVPHGYDAPPPDSLPEAEELRARYRLGRRRVIVYPAITHPHKGHRLLVELLAGPWADPDLVLVLLGGPGAAHEAVSTAIGARRVGERVVRPGRVPPADRDGLIALAEALVFPSEYEGFGAPVLEAMALGTPVICSDRAALPEIAGDAAVVLPPSIEAWADALALVATTRDDLVERGRRRAMKFTVAASGLALAAAYRLAHSGAT